MVQGLARGRFGLGGIAAFAQQNGALHPGTGEARMVGQHRVHQRQGTRAVARGARGMQQGHPWRHGLRILRGGSLPGGGGLVPLAASPAGPAVLDPGGGILGARGEVGGEKVRRAGVVACPPGGPGSLEQAGRVRLRRGGKRSMHAATMPAARRPVHRRLPFAPRRALWPRRRPGAKRGRQMRVKDVKKVVLAYSGGLDTSVILKWLQTSYGCEVVTFTADLGQGEELGPARDKALLLGIKPENIFMDDLRETFVKDFVFPMFRANALYEGMYLLGTSIARPLIAQRQIEIAEQVGADAVAHGATGKGNDQVRFELSYYALKPDIKIIAPWREWELTSRTRLIQFAEEHQIPIAKDKRGEAPFSVDANLLHSSSEGKILEEPWDSPDEMVWQRTISPMDAKDEVTEITIEFERGDAVGINGERLSPATLLTKLNALGRENGIGRLDLVENRFVGMKSRGCYETPGGTILYVAHRAMESITLDREACHLKDSLMPRYAEIIYNGFWFAPERRMLQALIDESQASVTGTVRLKLYKGNTIVTGRQSPHSLYSMKHVTFEDDQGAYDQFDAQGFIKLNALRLRLGAMAGRRGGAL
jgi:argininosuccinate synthase